MYVLIYYSATHEFFCKKKPGPLYEMYQKQIPQSKSRETFWS